MDELIAAVDFALTRPEPLILMNFAYPEQSTTEDVVRRFHEVAGFQPSYPVLPKPLLLSVALGCEALNALGFKNQVHRERVQKLVQSTRIAPRWLQTNGYEFGTDLRSALELWHAESGGSFE